MKWHIKDLRLILILFCIPLFSTGQSFNIESPGKMIQAIVHLQDSISVEVYSSGQPLLELKGLSMVMSQQGTIGKNAVLKLQTLRSVDTAFLPVVKQKSASVRDHYNEIKFEFEGNYSLVFRIYDEGVAYRFLTSIDSDLTIVREHFNLDLREGSHVYFPEEKSFFSHNERAYLYLPLDSITPGRFCSLPALAELPDGMKVLITESSLEDYPGLWLTGTGDGSLTPVFPAYPKSYEQTRDRDVKVTERYDFIAKTSGTREFPWRILMIARNDGELITNQLPWLLSPPCRIEDPSWIKPGKVAWDWWNANNIHGVDFKSGINTETYKYYIDFASAYGIEYIILDEGWYTLGDLLDIKPEIDLEEIIAYGRSKNVGIILWVIWKTLDDQLEEALDQFEAWGVKGIKVDFMQRDDQPMVEYYWKIAREAAFRHLLVDFHGAFKPSGLNRAWPNVLTSEGVRGLEWNKWSDVIAPDHDVTLPFIRMAAGPMDYTPGAMLNAQSKQFHAVFDRPMSQGTRCHQLAMYVVFESPLQMLADSPSNYLKEQSCMEFLSVVPTVWDDTKVLEAAVGEYVVVARKSGNQWFIGGMTDWTSREFSLDLSFLPEGKYEVILYEDGINSDRYAGDFSRRIEKLSPADQLKVSMSPGGGFTAVFSPEGK